MHDSCWTYKYSVPKGNVWNQDIGHLQQNDCVISVNHNYCIVELEVRRSFSILKFNINLTYHLNFVGA